MFAFQNSNKAPGGKGEKALCLSAQPHHTAGARPNLSATSWLPPSSLPLTSLSFPSRFLPATHSLSSMNDPEDFSNGFSQNSTRNRRLSDPGFPSEYLLQLSSDKIASRRQSDPGGHSVFALRDTLRPVTQQSMNSRSDGNRLSYAETSSATQSFVSADSGPTDTPTHSVVALDNASDDEAEDVSAPIRHESPTRRPTRYDTLRAHSGPTDTLAHSGVAYDTVSDAEPKAEMASAPLRHESPTRNPARRPTRNDILRVPPAAPQRTDPRQAATAPQRQPTTHSFTDTSEIDPVPAVALADETAHRSAGAPQRRGTRDVATRDPRDVATSSSSRPLHPSSGRDAPPLPDPAGVPQRRGTREVATPSQRRGTRDAATDVATSSASRPLNPASGREAPPPPESDPRRSVKVSATPTVVPYNRSDDNSRPPRPSNASNRAAPIAPGNDSSQPEPRPTASIYHVHPNSADHTCSPEPTGRRPATSTTRL
ncbi:hypothetical protein FB451DRAFT_301371 [Mycena latifolia]|nr:hypothetical protein FB451DRAFT_301371 [Mycena latifolia]